VQEVKDVPGNAPLGRRTNAVTTVPASAPPATGFRALLLGPFVLERDGVPIDTGRWRRRVVSLFKLLVVTPERRRHRDEVIDILWPDAGPEAGVSNLRITAHRLRLALGSQDPTAVLTEHGWIALNPAYLWDVDIVQFEELARSAGTDIGALERALGLIRGEPLVEERYEDWAMPIRNRLQATVRSVALRLSAGYQGSARHNEAVELLEHLLRDDPLDEEALRQLLEVLYSAGRRVEALRRYQQFEQHLAEELGAPPSRETMALVQRLNAQFPDPLPAEVREPRERPLPVGRFLGALPEAPIVARDEELERILFAADLVQGAKGRLLLLGGERGAGKTRLAQEVALRLRDRGFAVATGRCHERQQQISYEPFVEIMEALLPAVPPVFRRDLATHWPFVGHLLLQSPADRAEIPRFGQDVAGGDVDQQGLHLLLTSILGTLADQRGVALLLDDLHWSDPATLDLLRHLARQTAGHRILLLGTYRDDAVERDTPLDRMMRDLAREGLAERVAVRRLSLEGTAALVEATVGDMDGAEDFVDFVYRKTRGNPYYIDQMLQTLGGRYSLIRQVAAGSMGRIFEAVDVSSGDVVAAKIMFSRTEADPRSLARFEQEGAILARLQHPNIVAIHGTYLDEFTNCIVMEMLEGITLGRLMRTERLSLDRLKHIALQVTSALACAHEQGIVHRDIKPDNILVLPGDRVKVTDFGIARLVRPKASLTTQPSTGMTLGTPVYMAPEQVEGRRLDGRADLYSLGGVLYEALTGRPPFAGEDPLTVALKHVHEPPLPPRQINPEIPADWEELILKALAKTPAARFASATDMEQAIADLGSERDAPAGDRSALPAGTLLDASSDRAELLPAAPMTAASLVAPATGMESSALDAPLLPARSSQPPAPARTHRIRRVAWAGGLFAALLAGAGAVFAGSQLLARPTPHQAAQHTVTPGPPSPANGYHAGQFDGPGGIALNGQGDIYVGDLHNDRVQEFSPNGDYRREFPSPGDTSYYLRDPWGVAIAGNGDLIIADTTNERLVTLTSSGAFRDTIQRRARDGHYRDFDSVAFDRYGNLYATDTYHSQIIEITWNGRRLHVHHWGQAGWTPGRFNVPKGIALDRQGHVYVADWRNNRVQELILRTSRPYFTVVHIFGGRKGAGPYEMRKPQGVTVDRRGYVYVADTENNRVQEFSPSGTLVRTFKRDMSGPDGVAVDSQGNVYVSEYYNGRIDKFSPTGKPLWYSHGLHAVQAGR
jgi:serine/threonine protein kinase/DNA-binding SARP family transcriptional activator/DNA-binding beta-propeller fold protein YncE